MDQKTITGQALKGVPSNLKDDVAAKAAPAVVAKVPQDAKTVTQVQARVDTVSSGVSPSAFGGVAGGDFGGANAEIIELGILVGVSALMLGIGYWMAK